MIGIADYVKEPVTVKKENNIAPVPNYGTAFAPYFMSLSIWVGALIMFISLHMDMEARIKILSIASEKKMARAFFYLLLGVVQAVILGFVLQISLGLKIANTAFYYGACILISVVFVSIVQFLIVNFTDIGKFLSILLLILQLTSCGGTFPIETLPKFFQTLYPYMPMTYSIGLLKEAISGSLSTQAWHSVVMLFILLLVTMVLTTIFARIKTKNNNSDSEKVSLNSSIK